MISNQLICREEIDKSLLSNFFKLQKAVFLVFLFHIIQLQAKMQPGLVIFVKKCGIKELRLKLCSHILHFCLVYVGAVSIRLLIILLNTKLQESLRGCKSLQFF